MKNIFKLKNLLTLVAVAALAYGGYYFGTQNSDTVTSNKTLELTTVSIKKGDLEKKEEYNGTLRQTDSKVLNSPMSGVVTYVPKEGTVINFGEVLFAIDNKPVILLEGATPFYRTLDLNSNPGPDILQLEEALIYLGYAAEDFVPDETFDETTSNMLNTLYVDYKIDTKSEITSAEQVAINLKEAEVESIEKIIEDGGISKTFVDDKKKQLDDLIENSSVSITELNDKKKRLDDAKEAATEESAAWQAANNLVEDYYIQITLLEDLTNPKTLAKSSSERQDEIKVYEDLIEEQKRIRDLEKGKESGIDATEALAIETAQKAYDDALQVYNQGISATEALAIETAQKAYDDALDEYNNGVDQVSELAKAKKKSNKFANEVFNLLFLILLLLVLMAQVFMSYFVSLIAPGFIDDSEKMNLAINLTRITFPFLFLVSLASFFSAILNSHNRFAEAAAAPIILNIVLITILIFWIIHQLVEPISYILSGFGKILTRELIGWIIKSLKILIFILGSAAVLELWGIKIGPIIAGLGLFGVAVALGAQDLFKNLISGI